MTYKRPITKKEWEALASLVDLGAQQVADAESDHLDQTGRSRRNGGYSADLRIAERALTKLYKTIKRGLADEN